MLDAQKIILGTVSKLENTYFVTASMVDVESGKIEMSESVEASAVRFLNEAAETLAGRIAKAVR